MPENRTLVGYDLKELEPWAETQRRRRRARVIYKPAWPSVWVLLAAFLAILAVEYALAWAFGL